MKNTDKKINAIFVSIILLIIAIVVGVCASTSKINPYAKTTSSKVKPTLLPPIEGLFPVNPLKNDDKPDSAAKPVKELTLEEKTLSDSIVGEYVFKAEMRHIGGSF